MEDIINELQNLGFTKYESEIYTSLLQENPMTGYEISKLSGVPQSKVYENITRLLNDNVIVSVGIEPIKYIPISPSELIKSKEEKFSNSINKLKNNLDNINKSQSLEYVLNIKGYKNILEKARQMINTAKDEIIISSDYEEFIGLKDELITASGKNITVEILLPDNREISEIDKIYIHGGTENTVENKKASKGIIMVVDNNEILTGNLSKGNEAISIWTKNSNIIYIGLQYIKHEIYISEKIKEGGFKNE